MPESSGGELAKLYMRGVNEGREGAPVEAQALLDILDVFGEDGVRMYLVGILEGEEGAAEDEADEDPDAVQGFLDYETGEFTPIDHSDEEEEEDDPLDGPELP